MKIGIFTFLKKYIYIMFHKNINVNIIFYLRFDFYQILLFLEKL